MTRLALLAACAVLAAPLTALADTYAIEHVTVMIKLMHARSTTTFDPGDDFARVEQESLKHFTVAATQTILIAMPLAAVSALYPITFSDWHFCYLPMLIHASPITCKLLRAPPLLARELYSITAA